MGRLLPLRSLPRQRLLLSPGRYLPPSYGKGTRDFPRQCVFSASTNRFDWNTDDTGARRYNPIRCRVGNVALVREIREQLWGEAVALYEGGVPWHVVDPALAVAFREEQDARFRAHPWEERISAWLARPIDVPAGKTRAEMGVTTGDVLAGLGLDVTKWTQKEANDVALCLRRLGWRQGAQQRRSGVRVRPFFPAGATPAEDADSTVAHVSPPDRDVDTSDFDAPADDDLAALHGQ